MGVLDNAVGRLSCPSCGLAIIEAGDSCREIGSWVFLDCPNCHRLNDVTFAPIFRPVVDVSPV